MLDEQQVVRKDALTRTVLRSPVKGLVKNIRANTIGGIITSGSAVMEIVPMGARLLVEARIPPKEVGFVHVGQEAVIKLAGYDFNNLGGLEGKVEQISPDAIVDGEKVAGGDTRYYRALISAERKGLKYKGEDLPVLPGMTANIEIKTGQRSVLQYLLQPMLKSRDALKER
jgi:adhesin transport system membrane fusion protein